MGAWIFAEQPAKISVAQIVNLIRADVWSAIATLWTATMHALVAWLVLGSLASLVIYLCLAPVLRRLSAKVRAEAS
jgi:sensor c-di-GMP phosphodiesterase-like protein